MSKKEMGGRRRRRLSELGLPSLLSSLPRSASASASPLPFCRKLKSNFCFPLSLFSFHRLPPSVASPLFLPWLAASWAGLEGMALSSPGGNSQGSTLDRPTQQQHQRTKKKNCRLSRIVSSSFKSSPLRSCVV